MASDKRIATGRLARRNITPVDRSIVEEEMIDVSGFWDAGATFQAGDRLAPDQIEALAGGVRIDEIPSEVEALLTSNGLDLPEKHPDRRASALALTRSKVRALKLIERRGRGESINTPPRPPRVELAPEQASKPLLSAMRERWIEKKRPGTKQRDDTARYLRLFVSQHGDLPVDQITRRHVREFRDKLLRCPRNAPKSLTNAPLDVLVAWASKHPEKRKLARPTINNKALGTLSALLTVAVDDEHVQTNAAEGQKLEINEEDVIDREPCTVEELNAIFATAIYATRPAIPAAGRGAAAAWLPMLSLFTGARLEELGQLLVIDLRIEEGIPVIAVNDQMTLGGMLADAAVCKSVKTAAARRSIPIHAELIRILHRSREVAVHTELKGRHGRIVDDRHLAGLVGTAERPIHRILTDTETSPPAAIASTLLRPLSEYEAAVGGGF